MRFTLTRASDEETSAVLASAGVKQNECEGQHTKGIILKMSQQNVSTYIYSYKYVYIYICIIDSNCLSLVCRRVVQVSPNWHGKSPTNYVFMYVCMDGWMYAHVCTCMHMYAHVCTCMYVCMYVCIVIYCYITSFDHCQKSPGVTRSCQERAWRPRP